MTRLRYSLAAKLTIWFLLLSCLPIGVMIVFVRQNVADNFAELAADDTLRQVTMLARGISSSVDEEGVGTLLGEIAHQGQSAFLVGQDGTYVSHSDTAKVGRSAFDDLSDEVVQRILVGGEGVVVEEQTGRLVGFSPVPRGFSIAVLTVDGSLVSEPVRKIEQSAFVQLAFSLALVAVAGGIMIWILFFRPIQKLTRAAEQVGEGNLEVEVDPSDMEGELEILTQSFNQMTKRLQAAHEELEQRVADRTMELRESEERLRTTVTGAPIVLFALDKQGVFTLSEGQGLGALGLKPGEVVGQSVFNVYASVPTIIESCRRGLAGEEFTSIVEAQGHTFETLYSPLRAESGEVVGLIGVATDITERKRAEEALVQQTRELAVLGERDRLAREIHDTLAQGFTGIVVQLEAAEQVMEGSPADSREHLSRARSLARESLQEARRSVWGLLPQALEQRSLDAALQEEVRQFAAAGQEKASFNLSGVRRELASDVQTALLRICQECLTNIRRHANATEVGVDLTFHQEAVSLAIHDNGTGFDIGAAKATGRQSSFGLAGMEERARLLGGNVWISSEEGKGTLVDVSLPAA